MSDLVRYSCRRGCALRHLENKCISGHPSVDQAPTAVGERGVLRWQIASRLTDEVTVDRIGGTRFTARRSMPGVTGNIYAVCMNLRIWHSFV